VDEIVEHVELHEMDRSEHVGILSSAYLPAVSTGDGGDESVGASVEALLDVVARARGGDVDSEPVVSSPAGGAEGADTAVDDEGGFVDGAVDSFALGSDAVDEVWLSADHADQTAVDALRAAALDAARAAEEDADPEVRARAMGRLLAHVSLHVSMASEAGEYAMRDVVRHAIATVRER
jgi:uncharacterized protein YabN with tetrapyrrole methylase and pyrophosphatase domain